MSDEPPPNFRILKIVVVVLGIAILGMTGIIIVKGIEKFGESVEPRETATETPRTTAPVAAPGAPWQADVGSGRIISSELDNGLLMLVIENAEGVRRVEVLDAASGALRGRVISE